MSWIGAGTAAVGMVGSYMGQKSQAEAQQAQAAVQEAQSDHQREMQKLNNQMVDVNARRQWNALNLNKMRTDSAQIRQELELEDRAVDELAQLDVLSNFQKIAGSTVERSRNLAIANKEIDMSKSRQSLERYDTNLRKSRQDLVLQAESSKQHNVFLDPAKQTVNTTEVLMSGVQGFISGRQAAGGGSFGFLGDAASEVGSWFGIGTGGASTSNYGTSTSYAGSAFNQASAASGQAYNTNFMSEQSQMLASQEF